MAFLNIYNFFLELSRGEQRVSTPENGIKFENYTFIIIIFFFFLKTTIPEKTVTEREGLQRQKETKQSINQAILII